MARGTVSRRELMRFLGAAALAWGPIGATTGAQPAPSRRIRWAAGWLLWRDYKGLTFTLAAALQDLRQVGADGIEFTPRPGELEAAGLTTDAVHAMLRDAGLAVSAHYFSGPFHDHAKRAEILAQAKDKIDSLRAFGAVNMVIGPPAPPGGMSRLEAIARIAPALDDVGRLARASGITIGIHPHLNTVIETPEDTDAILARCDPALVGLALDTGHFHLAGGDVVAVLKKHGTRLNYLHVKDAVRPFARPDFFPNLRDLGTGEVDFPGVMRALRDLRYQGWINVEQDFTSTSPGASCRASMAYVRDVLRPIYS